MRKLLFRRNYLMEKKTLPLRLVRDVERTLQDRIDGVKHKTAEYYERCRAELGEVAETFGVEKDELFALAGVPKPEEKKKRRRRKKTTKKTKIVKKKVVARKKGKKKPRKKVATRTISTAKKRSGGTAEEKVAAFLKNKPDASGRDVSKATGYSGKTVYTTRAWKKRARSQ